MDHLEVLIAVDSQLRPAPAVQANVMLERRQRLADCCSVEARIVLTGPAVNF